MITLHQLNQNPDILTKDGQELVHVFNARFNGWMRSAFAGVAHELSSAGKFTLQEAYTHFKNCPHVHDITFQEAEVTI